MKRGAGRACGVAQLNEDDALFVGAQRHERHVAARAREVDLQVTVGYQALRYISKSLARVPSHSITQHHGF